METYIGGVVNNELYWNHISTCTSKCYKLWSQRKSRGFIDHNLRISVSQRCFFQLAVISEYYKKQWYFQKVAKMGQYK